LIKAFYFVGPLVNIAGQLIGPNIKGATSQLTFKMRGNTKPFGWHQDNGYGELDPYNALTTLTALDDTDLGNGCLWLIPGSHKVGQIRVNQTEEQKKSKSEIIIHADDSLAVPMEMKAGDSLIFNCWMLHKSDGNYSKDRDRRILFLRYADADAVEVYNDRKPRLGRLVKGSTIFEEVRNFEADL
jgi:ectoine hydroxylase-related dioxygenase (phytanoyl-CoA dioxygenase family)